MNRSHFETIQQAAAAHIKKIDELAAAATQEAKTDHLFADVVQAERKERRRAGAMEIISESAAAAKQKAVTEIENMRKAFSTHMTTTTDPGALQSLQALISAGITLSQSEVDAFAATGDYAALRLLEQHTKGRVKAPTLENFNKDMTDISLYFDLLAAYSGPGHELADAVTARPWGQSPTVAGAMLEGQTRHFPAMLDEISSRWDVVKED